MGIDLLRQQDKWKAGLSSLREMVAQLRDIHGYTDESMSRWKIFWDHQLYKALEHQCVASWFPRHTRLCACRLQGGYGCSHGVPKPPFKVPARPGEFE